jgi:hypothetical protein
MTDVAVLRHGIVEELGGTRRSPVQGLIAQLASSSCGSSPHVDAFNGVLLVGFSVGGPRKNTFTNTFKWDLGERGRLVTS